MSMAIPDAAFLVVQFCSCTTRTSYRAVSFTVILIWSVRRNADLKSYL